MTPKQAIEIAKADGVCQIKHQVWLWKTCEAAAYEDMSDIKAPFLLILGPHDWDKSVPVATEKNRKLREVCNGTM